MASLRRVSYLLIILFFLDVSFIDHVATQCGVSGGLVEKIGQTLGMEWFFLAVQKVCCVPNQLR